MTVLLAFRVMLALLVAVLPPLGQAHCALTMPHPPAAATVQTEHRDGDDDDCCSESAPDPASSTDPCCCDHIRLPSATAPASISVDASTSGSTSTAVMPVVAAGVTDQNAHARLEPDARSGSLPDPSADPQSPRSPPQSA